jgi:hypothetical protein
MFPQINYSHKQSHQGHMLPETLTDSQVTVRTLMHSSEHNAVDRTESSCCMAQIVNYANEKYILSYSEMEFLREKRELPPCCVLCGKAQD